MNGSMGKMSMDGGKGQLLQSFKTVFRLYKSFAIRLNSLCDTYLEYFQRDPLLYYRSTEVQELVINLNRLIKIINIKELKVEKSTDIFYMKEFILQTFNNSNPFFEKQAGLLSDITESLNSTNHEVITIFNVDMVFRDCRCLIFENVTTLLQLHLLEEGSFPKFNERLESVISEIKYHLTKINSLTFLSKLSYQEFVQMQNFQHQDLIVKCPTYNQYLEHRILNGCTMELIPFDLVELKVFKDSIYAMRSIYAMKFSVCLLKIVSFQLDKLIKNENNEQTISQIDALVVQLIATLEKTLAEMNPFDEQDGSEMRIVLDPLIKLLERLNLLDLDHLRLDIRAQIPYDLIIREYRSINQSLAHRITDIDLYIQNPTFIPNVIFSYAFLKSRIEQLSRAYFDDYQLDTEIYVRDIKDDYFLILDDFNEIHNVDVYGNYADK